MDAKSALDGLARENLSLKDQLSEASRTNQREGVNMEYLKNIMVQYLCLRDSSQKQTLEHVLATLLQFSQAESREIQQAKSAFFVWSSPKLIQPPMPTTASTPLRPSSRTPL